jgi:hypothetical protein
MADTLSAFAGNTGESSRNMENKSMIFERNNPLFFYGNEEKLDDLLCRIYGTVLTEFSESDKSNIKGSMKLSAKFGQFLSFLNVGELGGEAGAEANVEDSRHFISKVGFDSKLDALASYCADNEPFPYFDSFNGKRLKRNRSSLPLNRSEFDEILESDKIDCIGQVVGIFHPTRVLPPHDQTASIAEEFRRGENTLWLFSASQESKVNVEIPILLSNCRLVSQYAVMSFVKSSNSYFKIEALGLLTWVKDKIVCDPVAWRLFH